MSFLDKLDDETKITLVVVTAMVIIIVTFILSVSTYNMYKISKCNQLLINMSVNTSDTYNNAVSKLCGVKH